MCAGAGLSPPGHAGVDQSRVSGEALVGADAEPLGNTWTGAFNEDVGLLCELQRGIEIRGVLEIEGDGPAASHEPVSCTRIPVAAAVEAFDPYHLCSHVGEHHGAVRSGADAREFEDADARKRPRGVWGRHGALSASSLTRWGEDYLLYASGSSARISLRTEHANWARVASGE